MMFRTPPPGLAMTLAEDRRHNLMESAGKRPTGSTDDRNRSSFLYVVVSSLGQLVRCLEATLAKFQTASKVDRVAEPPWGQ
jgi:hypothetical protein